MDIISKIGSTIARNRTGVKSILDKYNIPAGNSNSDRIRAVFTAIKSGNTDLAADISALSSIGGAKTKVSPAKAKDTIAKIKSITDTVKELLKKNPKTNGSNKGLSTTVNPVYIAPSPTVSAQSVSAANQIISGSKIITDHPIDHNEPINIPDSVNQLAADGNDEITSDSLALVNAVNSADVETNVAQASIAAKTADMHDTRTLLALALVLVVITIAILKSSKFSFSK